jgi:hypothetical protein
VSCQTEIASTIAPRVVCSARPASLRAAVCGCGAHLYDEVGVEREQVGLVGQPRHGTLEHELQHTHTAAAGAAAAAAAAAAGLSNNCDDGCHTEQQQFKRGGSRPRQSWHMNGSGAEISTAAVIACCRHNTPTPSSGCGGGAAVWCGCYGVHHICSWRLSKSRSCIIITSLRQQQAKPMQCCRGRNIMYDLGSNMHQMCVREALSL